jgi:regulator of sigma E protease
MLTGIFVFIGLSILILGHEAGHFFAARFFKLKIDEFGFGFPPRIFAWRPKNSETEYSLNWLPFGGFVKIAGENDRMNEDVAKLKELPEAERKRIFLFQPAWKRAVVLLAGVAVNFLIGWILITAIFMVGVPRAIVVSDVVSGSPAETAGFKKNDVILQFSEAELFTKFINDNKGRPTVFEVKRGDAVVQLTATPNIDPKPGEGALGVQFVPTGFPKESFFSAIFSGFTRTFELAWGIVLGFLMIIKNILTTGTLPDDVVGPVGIFGVASDVGKLGVVYLIHLISLISINLAVINLLPFPALDGGRFFMLLIEKIKGSPIPIKVEGITNAIGFGILILLMLVVTFKDIVKLF